MDNKEMQGVLFPHNKKNDKQPDYKGTAKIGGIDYEIAVWKKVGKQSGAEYMSVAFQKKGERKAAPAPSAQQKVNEVAKAVGGKTELTNNNTIYEEVPF